MQLFKSVLFSRPGSACQHCVHFENDPALVEAAYRGITAMSSGFASVRDRDGFCGRHQLYLSAWDSCPEFEPPAPRRDVSLQ
jgi:hypothetical protein